MMKTNHEGRELIKRFEGKELVAYRDTGGVWTIGYGHTSAAGKPEVVAGLTITDEKAEEILKQDLGQYERAVDHAIEVKMTENQFSAMVSLCYNIGPSAFAKSSVAKHMNAGNLAKAASSFLLWNKDNGKVLEGLTRRREAEKKLFEKVEHHD